MKQQKRSVKKSIMPFCANFLLLWAAIVWPDEFVLSETGLPVKSKGEIEFYFDSASFRAAQGQALQEFYYQIPFEQLEFRPVGAGFEAEFKTGVTLSDSAGQVLLRDEWTQPLAAAQREEIAGRSLPNQFELTLSPGRYFISLAVSDSHSGKQGIAESWFRARAIPENGLALSDLQAASSIAVDTSQSKFSKNGLKVVPHASAEFSPSQPLFYFYFEIYNLAPADSYEVHYSMKNAHGEVLRSLPAKMARAQASSSVEVGGIHAGNLPDSIAFLAIDVRERRAGERAAIEKAFRIRASAAAWREHLPDLELEQMTEAEFKLHLEQAQYLLSDDDKSMLKALEVAAQKSFVGRLWRQLDPRPETPANEFREEYYKRVRYAEEKFSSGFSPGWKSDRGRIAIKFGAPNEVERYPAKTTARPYEVWTYYREGRKQFIFADIEGFGKYVLIYSSDERELTRPDWKMIIDAR